MKDKATFVLFNTMIILCVGCGPKSPASIPKIETEPRVDAPATATPTAQPAPAGDATLPRTTVPTAPSQRAPVPSGSTTPTEAPKRLWTAVPITQTETSIEKDKNEMSGVPIPTPLDPTLEKIALKAKEDLAKRLTINVDQISLVEVQSVTWPDGSLGCPQPGMAYIQVQVDGLLIRLSVGGNIYEYHGGGSRSPFLCKPGH